MSPHKRNSIRLAALEAWEDYGVHQRQHDSGFDEPIDARGQRLAAAAREALERDARRT